MAIIGSKIPEINTKQPINYSTFRRLRVSAGYRSAAAFGVALGVHTNSVYNYERGNWKIPIATLDKAAELIASALQRPKAAVLHELIEAEVVRHA
jgi:transcriptional regulator with XRE-family HTH domain